MCILFGYWAKLTNDIQWATLSEDVLSPRMFKIPAAMMIGTQTCELLDVLLEIALFKLKKCKSLDVLLEIALFKMRKTFKLPDDLLTQTPLHIPMPMPVVMLRPTTMASMHGSRMIVDGKGSEKIAQFHNCYCL